MAFIWIKGDFVGTFLKKPFTEFLYSIGVFQIHDKINIAQ